jgi:glutamine synthetase
MQTDCGKNLLTPGKTREDNIRFLFFVCAFLEGIYKHGDLLRASVASASNDHRLGQNEAPPAIMSVYLGDEISSSLDELTKTQTISSTKKINIDTGLAHLQNIKGATTDRNRTSPIAFTGNKFEFRACGSSQSVGLPITILNAAVAEGIEHLNKQLIKTLKTAESTEAAILSVLRESARNTLPIRFDGNCYDKAWVEEAKKRGLPNLLNAPSAMEAFRRKENIRFLDEMGVLKPHETEVRRRVKLGRYIRLRTIECQCLEETINNSILPALFSYRTMVAPCEHLGRVDSYLEEIDDIITELLQGRSKLVGIRLTADNKAEIEEKALFIGDTLLPSMDETRKLCDEAERIVPDNLWPLAKYREMLFLM